MRSNQRSLVISAATVNLIQRFLTVGVAGLPWHTNMRRLIIRFVQQTAVEMHMVTGKNAQYGTTTRGRSAKHDTQLKWCSR